MNRKGSVSVIAVSLIANALLICNYATIAKIIACQDRFLALGTDKNMAEIVDVTIGETVRLHCDFCMDKVNLTATEWYYKQRGSNHSAIQIVKGMTNKDKSKVSVKGDNILEVQSFDNNESGIYICKSLNRRDNYIFTYVLDGVFSEIELHKTGSINQWQEYKHYKIDPINKMFEKSQEEPFVAFRNTFKFSFRLKTLWKYFESCEEAINMRQIGIRKKVGKCRLHPIRNNNHKVLHRNNNEVENINAFYLLDNYDVSCCSIKLNETLPEISRIVRFLPEFQVTETCNLALRPRPFVKEIMTDFKYNATKQLAENGHFTLICPEICLQSEVQWYKNGILLDSSYRSNMAENEEEPHITIDSSNSLYILHATKFEEGIYSCTVNSVKMQKTIVKVVAKCKLLNDEFIRYSIYLGFVLSLTMTCYCTGICVAWHRRTSFADPLNLHANQERRLESF